MNTGAFEAGRRGKPLDTFSYDMNRLFACAVALERNPVAVQAVREDGIDVCCHGWRWMDPSGSGEGLAKQLQ